MDPLDYLRALARRWKVIVACIVVALGVGWIVTAGEEPQGTSFEPGATFQATTHLLSSAPSGTSIRGTSNLDTVATLALLGEVPRRVAESMGFDDPDEVTSNIQVTPDTSTGLLAITATADDPGDAERLADTFAADLMSYLRQRTLQQVRVIESRLESLDGEIAQAQADLEAATTEQGSRDAQEQQDSLSFEQTFLEQQRFDLVSEAGGNPSGFEIIERADAHEIVSEAGIRAPQSRALRLLIAAVIGLILGFLLALLLERFDTRIRTKEAAEGAFKLPALAEIPVIPRRRRRRGSIVAEAFPHAPASNAFRLLAAALQFGRHQGTVRDASGNGFGGSKTILVTSSAPAEGKSTIVANLAATFSEVGKRVVVLCCDFRHPTLDRTFGIQQAPGLAEALEGDTEPEFESLLQETAFDRVRVVATGQVPDKTAGLFGSERFQHVLKGARSVADIVLIDTAPVLAASDWTQILPEVDAVLVVARAGKTDAGSAARTVEILRILQAPVVGVALNRLSRSASRRAGYRYGNRSRYRASPVSVVPVLSEPVAVTRSAGDEYLVAEGIARKSEKVGREMGTQASVGSAPKAKGTSGAGTEGGDGGNHPLARPSDGE